MSDYFYVDREEFECVQNVALGSYGIFTQDSSGNLLYEGKYIYYEGNLVPGVTDAGLPNHYYTMVNVVGTSWEFDSAPTALTSSAVFNFNFKTNSASYTKLTVIVDGSTVTIKYDDTVCYQNGWTNGTYRRIRVIDGAYASNWQLAAFLIDNAVNIINGTKNISGNIGVDGDFNVNGAIKQNGSPIGGGKLYACDIEYQWRLSDSQHYCRTRFLMYTSVNTQAALKQKYISAGVRTLDLLPINIELWKAVDEEDEEFENIMPGVLTIYFDKGGTNLSFLMNYYDPTLEYVDNCVIDTTDDRFSCTFHEV